MYECVNVFGFPLRVHLRTSQPRPQILRNRSKLHFQLCIPPSPAENFPPLSVGYILVVVASNNWTHRDLLHRYQSTTTFMRVIILPWQTRHDTRGTLLYSPGNEIRIVATVAILVGSANRRNVQHASHRNWRPGLRILTVGVAGRL